MVIPPLVVVLSLLLLLLLLDNNVHQFVRQFVHGGTSVQLQAFLSQFFDQSLFQFGFIQSVGRCRRCRGGCLGGYFVVRHVLHHRHTRHAHGIKHFNAPHHVRKGQFLRRRDNDGRRNVEPLREGQLNVPRPGRHINDEVIQRPPVRHTEYLIQQLGDHGPAHDGRPVVDVAKGHEADAVALQRRHLATDKAHHVVVGRHHGGQARPVHVRVQNADRAAQRLQAVGEVDGRGGFSDAAFAGGNGNDGADLGHAAQRVHVARRCCR